MIRAAHEQDRVVIVGRAGQVVLHNVPNVLHVRVVAPVEQRMERIQQIAGLTADAAREVVHRRDQAAADYVKSFYHADWTNPLLYDIVINTHNMPSPVAVDLIITALEHLPAFARQEPPNAAA